MEYVKVNNWDELRLAIMHLTYSNQVSVVKTDFDLEMMLSNEDFASSIYVKMDEGIISFVSILEIGMDDDVIDAEDIYSDQEMLLDAVYDYVLGLFATGKAQVVKEEILSFLVRNGR